VFQECRQLRVEFSPHLGDLRGGEAVEVVAGPVEGEAGSAGALPDHGVQRRVQHHGRLVPVHALGQDAVAHQVGDSRGGVAGQAHDRAHVEAKVDQEPERRRLVDEFGHLAPRRAARDEGVDLFHGHGRDGLLVLLLELLHGGGDIDGQPVH